MKVAITEGVMEESLHCRTGRTHGVCRSCPMALAINRAFGLSVGEGWTDGQYWGLMGSRSFALPEDAVTWINQYDRWYTVLYQPEIASGMAPTERPQVPIEFDL